MKLEMAERRLLALMTMCTVWAARVTGDCGKPPDLENGSPTDESISRTLFPVGSMVFYKCYPGYMFKEGGSKRISCKEDSTWLPLQAVCEPRDCGNPGELLNGYYDEPSSTFGGIVTFHCDQGYRMVGRAFRSCKADGWDGQVPTCEAVICADPPPISNGRTPTLLYTENWEYGMVAEYSCIGDYSLIGADELACTGTGQWDKDPPTCKVVRCHRPELIVNARMVAGFGPTYTYRDRISYRCNKGYEMVGNNVIECSENNIFVPQPPMCKPPVECHSPKLPTNGRILSGFGPTYRRWDKIAYSCNEGYEMVGSSVIECSENNAFVPPPPTCRPRTCGKPPQLEHGSLEGRFISWTSFSVGSRVAYRCCRGYIFKEGGSRYVICSHNSTWTPLQATCEPRHCGNPGEILDGYSKAPNDTLGSQVIFYCDKGYRIVGKDHRVCTAAGWDGQVPTCRPVTCADLPRINKGIAPSLSNGDHWEYGMVAKYSCHDGNSLIGAEKLVCTENGEWDKDPPTCKVVRCKRPKLIVNGQIVAGFGPTYSYRETITYSCNKGYAMDGNSVIECSESNTFVSQPPTCRHSVTCADPPTIINGRTPTLLYGDHWEYGMVARYSCIGDYSLIGADELVCTATGKWDKDPPTCKAVTCADPPPISNGRTPTLLYGDHWEYGMVARYSCIGDYSLIGADELVCTATGKWDKDPPTCKAVTCADPPPISNGRTPTLLYGDHWEYGMVARYSCIGDYSLIGADELVCAATGKWDKDPPTCKAVNCGNPREILNGYYETSGTAVGSKATFYCDKGYQIVGRDFQMCTADGWDGQVPTCESMDCGNPGEILNGYYTTFGSKVTFYCEEGYEMVGRDYQWCTAEGWDGRVPTCKFVGCHHPELPANSRIVAGFGPTYKHRETITYSCNEDYEMVGHSVIECTESNTFVPSPPTCKLSLNCGNPGEILNGYYEAPYTTFGSKVTFYCKEGYRMVGRNYRLCTADGWDGEVPTCEFVGCQSPELLANGHIVTGFGPTYKHQETITYSCNEGYEMVGNSVIECSENNTFVPPPPTCRPRSCGKLPQLENASPTEELISRTSFAVGTEVTYSCSPGYTLKDKSSRSVVTCQVDATWTPLQAICEPLNCGNPGEILNGYYEAPYTTFGSKVTFYCKEGYRMVGRNYRLCAADGWNGQVPTCEFVGCQSPELLANGHIVTGFGPTYKHQETITYSCNEGYEMVGNSVIECSENSTFVPLPPTCRPLVGCQPPELLTNGHIVTRFVPTYKRRETITYSCNEGYEMVGNSVIECSENNTFVPPPPTCRPRSCGKLPQLENASPTEELISRTSFAVGTEVTYSCSPGYTLKDKSSRSVVTCQVDATWTPLQAICEPLNCGNPGEILNGYYEAPYTTFGSKVTFYCKEGYRMVGRNYRLCAADGWDGQVPTCEFVGCQSPELLANGHIVTGFGPTYKHQETITYSCNEGYEMVGNSVIECSENSTFVPLPPTCRPLVGCQPPELLTNGHIVTRFGPTYKRRETITYSCNEGYEMVGNSVIECSENNTFVPPPPTCRPRSCGKLPQLENASPTEELISRTSFAVGTEVTYSCFPGYTLKDKSSRSIVTCQVDATWTPLQSICEPPSGFVQTIVGIILGIVAGLVLIVCGVCCYLKQLSHKGQFYLTNIIPMSPQNVHIQVVSRSDETSDCPV